MMILRFSGGLLRCLVIGNSVTINSLRVCVCVCVCVIYPTLHTQMFLILLKVRIIAVVITTDICMYACTITILGHNIILLFAGCSFLVDVSRPSRSLLLHL